MSKEARNAESAVFISTGFLILGIALIQGGGRPGYVLMGLVSAC